MTGEQDTLLSLPLLGALTYREWHGLIDGLYCGARWGSRQHDYTREQHYWRIGYLLATLTRYLTVLGLYWWVCRSD